MGLGGPIIYGVLTIKRRLILGTLIAYGVATVATAITFPTVAIELSTDVRIHTVEAYEQVEEVEGAPIVLALGSREDEVRAYFKDIPVMAEIARCESQFTHVDPKTGKINRGRINPEDVGVMQINEYYHRASAQKMGLEIFTFEDNMAYARHLYEQEGTNPWKASQSCWQNNNLLAIR
ncbi:MAG: hypothetical protein UV60_C0008G0026 [Parcubacteria group bacterium GW2011_GWA2_43_11]|nr:MAG: hypothetical protein UU89_C0009G0020 [Parcubacteria group bacterium GW2011_GWC2_42_11]KKS85404.1 MAG: hypothetical protein UV60_C0008G0026 [Parcubacteria group bacterium GW2011_GWA2_43_11]